MIAVTTDDRVLMYPGTPLEEQDFMKGRPEYHFHLRGGRVTNDVGVEQVACRDGKVYLNGKEEARLGDGWFESATTKVVIAQGGDATILRRSDNQPNALRYVGLPTGDICTAALLFYMVPVPRAG